MIIVALFVLGLVFGSFVNAWVWRLHEYEELHEQLAKAKSAKARAGLKTKLKERSMLHGRSMCSSCHHPLAIIDLVPLVSWLLLRGRCRYCKAPIQDSPIVEVVTASLLVVSYIWWPFQLSGIGLVEFGFWVLYCVIFMALAVYDLRWFILPDRVVLPLAAVAFIETVIIAIATDDIRYVVWAVAGALTLSGIFWLLFQVSDGKWIGGGDVKLALALGLLASTPLMSLLLLFAASIIGTVLSVPLLLRGRSGLRLQVPFGPYLLAATVTILLFGQSILDWYARLLRV